MSLSTIRTALDTALSGISGLQHYKSIPSILNPPAALIGLKPVDSISYDFTAQNASLVYHMYIECLVNKGATLEEAQDDLDDYLQNKGVTSIKAVIEAIDWTGVADCCRVMEVSNYGPATYGGAELLGARLMVDIWVSS